MLSFLEWRELVSETTEKSPEEVVKLVISSFKSAYSRGIGSDDIQGPDKNGSWTEMYIRYWGTWHVPQGEEDDGDYDWEELDDKWYKKGNEILDSFKKQYPYLDFQWKSEEKNWLTISVKKK